MFDIDAALRYVDRARGLRPAPQGPLAADGAHPRRAGPIEGAAAAGARGHRGGPRPPPRRATTFARSSTPTARPTSPTRSRGSPAFASTPSASAARLDRLPRDPLPGADDRRPRPAPGDPQARRGAARDHPAHRHHRLGQVHDPGGDDRPHQLDAAAPRDHARGPDRVPAPRQAVDHQPARGRLRHEQLRPRDAPRAAPGPRRDPDRRDARRGDGAHRAQRGRDRPPRPLAPCTPSTPPRRSTGSSTSSRRICSSRRG